jgi:hypothetical protein
MNLVIGELAYLVIDSEVIDSEVIDANYLLARNYPLPDHPIIQ